jgi:c-di-GMP phosphodiesterase
MQHGVPRRNLGYRQAEFAVLIALAIGILAAAIQFAYFSYQARGRAARAVEDMVAMARGPAGGALWAFDWDGGRQVVEGLVSLYYVRGAEIHDGQGAVFASATRPDSAHSPLAGVIASFLLSDLAVIDTEVEAMERGQPHPVGRLTIRLSTVSLAEEPAAVLVSTIVLTLAQSLALGLILAAASNRFLTWPLRRVEVSLRRISPTDPAKRLLPVPRDHEGDELGHLVGGVNQFLSELDRAQAELRQLASRDSLTGLPNRASLLDVLRQALGTAKVLNGKLAVLFIDLDRFKTVNDSLGHSVGDRLLVEVGGRLGGCVGEAVCLGRLGGDEFLVILPNLRRREDAEALARQVLTVIAAPMVLAGQPIRVGASIGIAVGPDDGDTIDGLLSAADTAMYAAKRSSSGSVAFFTTAMADRAHRRLSMEASLRRGLENGEFVLHYQPKVRIDDLTPVGLEALLRWHHEDRTILPGEFIPIAEEVGLIEPLGAWVMEAAARQLADWARRSVPLPVAINVSGAQFNRPGFAAALRDTVGNARIDSRLIEIEVTETVLMHDLDGSLEVLNDLREAGFRVAIDDFGTGYSSLNYLRRLPLDTLKLDRTFIADIPNDTAIVSAVLSLGRHFGLDVVAEGVETPQQRAWLQANGCPTFQGWLVSRAVPPEMVEAAFLPPLAAQAAYAG